MKTKYYEITGETGLGYTVSGRWNYRERKWLFGEADDRHDGTGTTFESLEAAEAELPFAQDADVRNINIYSGIVEDEEVEEEVERQTVEHDGETYTVVPHKLEEDERLLGRITLTKEFKECKHEHTERLYIAMGCYRHPEMTYTPESLIISPKGRIQICLDCGAGKWYGDWDDGVFCIKEDTK